MTSRALLLPALLLCALSTWTAGVSAQVNATTPQENWNVVLTPVVTEFQDHTGLDHHQPSRKLILSANAPTGAPNSFELLAGDGGHSGFSNVAGLQGEVLVATARDDGQGMSRGGFQPGTVFASTGAPGVVARISADGASVQNPWVTLPEETGLVTGLHIDRTGTFGGDLIVVTAAGGVWRVSSSALPAQVAALGTSLAGAAVVPNDLGRYGPWAGKILVGAKDESSVYAVDAQGESESLQVGLDPQDIDIVPAHENLYAIDPTSRKLLGATEDALTSVIGDILVTQESPGLIARVRWDGAAFVVTGLAEAAGLKQVAFSPAGAGQIPAVKQVYEKIAVVRHAPQLNSGRIEGTLWQLTAEDTLFDGTDTITSDLLVPGTPEVAADASASYGGTVEGTESSEPSDYTVILTGNASLRHVVTRTDPIELQDIAFPPAPTGTRDVQLRKASDLLGNPATLRHLDIAGNAGAVAVPPGTYGRFTVSGRNTLVFGVAGSTEPAVYNLEALTLTGGSELRLAGPVRLRVRNTVTLVGSSVGAADDPKRLLLEVADGSPDEAVTIGGNGVLYAIVRAPQGTISIEGNGRLRGTVACDVLQVDGNGVLQITENDIPPPPVNRPPSADAGPDHTITLPTDTVALEGTASDDGLPADSTLDVTWTKVSGPGPVTFTDEHSAATSATFSEAGEYVLKLTASDGQLSSSDTTTITVIPRNQAPVVDAGPEQTIELPAPAELRGTVSDDALPRGSEVTVTWSMVNGPGTVTFADPQAAVTTASFDVPGVYTLRLSANDTEFTVTDDVIITVLKNEAPSVNAGPDHTITLPVDTVALEGTATDDGLPSGSTLEVTWRMVSGPAPVTFANAASAATSATFSVDGEYVLELTASDGQLSGSDTITVTVIPRNFPPVVDAGPAQTIELPAQAALSGTVTDDGLPRGSVVTLTWSLVDGPGPVTFANPQAAVTTVFFSSPGVYTLRLSASDTELTVSDDVVITVLQNEAPTVAAGPDQETTLPSTITLNGTASDDGMPTGSTLEVFWGQVSGPAPVIFHDAFTAMTPVTITAPGTYVLRLTATDSELSAQDELTVVVHPRPNQPPQITSEPITELLLGAVPTGGGETVNLGSWTVQHYPGSQPAASWQRDATNTIATQTINADPSILLSDFNLSNAQMEGTWRVNTSDDDDYIGFVFGYQNAQHFYLFDWKQANQDAAARGMSLKVVSADSPLTTDDFWPSAGNGTRVRSLYRNTIGWAEFTDYQFTLQFYPGEIRIIVKRGTTVLADFTVNDSTYTNGRFGFYNYSQAQVRYSGFRRLSLARGTYTYDVEAIDLDGDALTYSLDTAPVGMTIDAATGLITWPVSSAVAGNHQVAVRVRTPDGRFDVQSYTLTILSPNEPPVVNAGDDRLITTGSSASLTGTVTDDGFPRNSTLGFSWSTVSGPGTVTFANPSIAATTATFSASGTYLLRLSANDGELSASDEATVTVNTPPVVNAGADQTLTQSNTVVLNGTASDDGVPSGDALAVLWSQVSGPGTASFGDPGSAATRAIFPAPGTYTLRLTGNDSLHSRTDDVIITVNASPALDGATLSLVPGNVDPYTTGSTQPLRATLRRSDGNPLANYGVEFQVTGPNATAGSAVTDASGIATFSYTGTNIGTDTIRAFVRNAATTIDSPTVSITWTQATNSPPATQGWIGGPLHGNTVTGLVPITVGTDVTLTQGTIEYWPVNNPSTVTVLAPSVQGGPGATLATLDTTLLANGNYVIRLRANDSNGQELVSQVMITVAGEDKPGRITLSVTDLTVPAAGLPITITRRYDSLERNKVGDFGYGWSLEMAGPRLEVSPDYDVTITEPGTGRRVTFQFAPTSFGFPFNFLYQPTYAPEPGVYGKLAANGCGTLIRSGGGVACYLSSDLTYRPTVYAYTDPDGRVYTMTDSGKMQSIKDLNGNILTFSAAGITSSAGSLNVPFVRDAQGRIARISDPAGNHYDYSYDTTGDLVAVAAPGVANPVQYEYAPGHLLNKEIDPRGGSTSATYYPDGRIQSETDRMGNTTQYAYDVSTRTTTTTYPDGGVMVRTNNASGNPVSIKDQLNRITTITYDVNQNVLTRIDPLGKTWTFTYDANGNLTSTRDPLGNTESRTWDSRGRLLTITDALNQVKTFQYDAAGNVSALQDALGQLAAATYDAEGSQTSLTLSSGRSARFSYDSRGNRIGLIDHSGFARTQGYDSFGNLTSMSDSRHGEMTWEHDPLGNLIQRRDSLGATLTYTYDANGNRIGETDANGNLYTHEYDAADRLIATTYPDGSRTTMTYDFAGRLLSKTDGDGIVERFVWDMAGQLVSATSAHGTPLAATTTYTYDLAGRLNSVIDARNNATVFTSDDAGRVKSIQDPAGRTSTFTYNSEGQVTAVTRADNLKREARYDARGRTTSFINPDGTSVQHIYDGMFLRASTNEEGKMTSYTYDEHSEIASVTDPAGHQTRYLRDEVGNLIGVIDANGHETRYEYDGEDRLVKKILPGGSFEQYTYDPVGHIVAIRLNDGNVNHLTWDGMDRLLRIDYFDGTAATFTYSATGKRLTATTEAGVKEYEYDDLDRLIRITQPNGVVITYGYDAASNITSITTPRGVTSYTYDVLDQIKTVTDPSGGVTAYTYDLGGRLIQRLLPNGAVTDYSYDTLDRLTSVAHRLGTSGSFESFVYTFSPTGQRLSVQETSGARTNWTYDDASRLIREVVFDNSGNTVSEVRYTYDQVGNRTSMTANGITTFYHYNELDQLTVAGSVRYTYDGRGNLVRVTDGSSITKYSYDAANRLTAVVMPNGVTTTYGYDADGLLIRETVGNSVRNYGWNEISQFGDIVYESDSSGASIAYSYGGDDLVQRLGTTSSYYIADGLGSIVGLTNSAGVQTDRYRYDAWGVRTLVQGSTVNPFGYRGQWTDSTTSLQYLRARHFSPGTGRFLTRDIAAFDLNDPIDLNRYTYAGANPINAYDPTGYTVAAEYGALAKRGQENATILGYRVGRFAETLLTCTLNAILAQSVDAAWRQMAIQKIPNPFNKNGKPPWEGKANRITVAFGWTVKRPLDLIPDDPVTEAGRRNLMRKAALYRAGPRELSWALSGSRAERLFEFLGTTAHETLGIDGVFLGNTANGADKCENHAERKIVRHARPPLNALLSVGASRPVCPTCDSVLKANNVGCAAPLGGKRTCVP